MRDNLFHLTKVDQEGAMATDNHRIVVQRFLHLFHGGTKHVGMHLSVAQVADLNVVSYSLYI